MTLEALRDILWECVAQSLKGKIAAPDKFIRWLYPENGAPDWKATDTIVFLYLIEVDDDFARQWDSSHETRGGTVWRDAARTRVWDLQVTCYGVNAYEVANLIKDSFYREAIRRKLSRANVHLVPNLSPIKNAPELFAGRWQDRWDVMLRFNELYTPAPEDAGHIEIIKIRTGANRP